MFCTVQIITLCKIKWKFKCKPYFLFFETQVMCSKSSISVIIVFRFHMTWKIRGPKLEPWGTPLFYILSTGCWWWCDVFSFPCNQCKIEKYPAIPSFVVLVGQAESNNWLIMEDDPAAGAADSLKFSPFNGSSYFLWLFVLAVKDLWCHVSCTQRAASTPSVVSRVHLWALLQQLLAFLTPSVNEIWPRGAETFTWESERERRLSGDDEVVVPVK